MGDRGLALSAWRFALASVIGSGHAKAGLPCQDAATARVIDVPDLGEVLIAAISDGAGSANRAHDGSRLATDTIVADILCVYWEGQELADLTCSDMREWLVGVRTAVQKVADRDGAVFRDYACTLLCAVVEPHRAAFLQIGDGAIVISPRGEPDEYSWEFWPQRGEYANLTRFVTDEDAAERVELTAVRGEIDEVAIFSDGLQPLALQYAEKTAYAPLFRSLFGPVRSAPPGRRDDLSLSLAAFLASGRVSSRTDDDKSIVLATRCPSGTQTASQPPASAANELVGGDP